MISEVYWRLKTQTYYRRSFGGIGRGSTIRKPLLLARTRHIRVGCDVHIRDGARLEVVYDGSGREPCLRIGDGVNIEQNAHIVCHNRVTIGPGVCITGGCAIVDTTHIFDPSEVAGPVALRIATDDAYVDIGAGSFLGFGAAIMPGVSLGKNCVVGAHSVVTRSFPDGSMVVGAPARLIRYYCADSRGWSPVRDAFSAERGASQPAPDAVAADSDGHTG